MGGLKLYWLGHPMVTLDGELIKLETRKAVALLAYLSIETRAFPREILASLFWPDHDQQRALANLRRTLFSLTQPLREYIVVDRETVALNVNSSPWIDVQVFKNRQRNNTDHLADLEAAADLYRGDFLEGLNLRDCPDFDDWQYLMREALRQDFATLLESLSDGYVAQGHWESAIGHARRWVNLDRLNERAQHQLMNLYARSGQRQAAERQYKLFVDDLWQELGQSPSAETIQLYEQIRSQGYPKTDRIDELLIRTKLNIPGFFSNIVHRPRLSARLDEGSRSQLTLVSAPAGFGKTTVLADWAIRCAYPVAWLSLDSDDNEIVPFLNYLLAAIENIGAGLSESALALLRSSRLPSANSILTALINELSTLRHSCALILDDYHVIRSEAVHQAVMFLLDHLSEQVHLVIATRSDPPLPLARLRARSQLVEIRADDLRFTSDEAAAFLEQVVNLSLSPADISTLETRTEGWIVGLQMAALSMRNRKDVGEFIEGFSGTNRYIMDYLLEEVLASQPPEIQRFLLYTSILERLTAPLCDAILADGERSKGEGTDRTTGLESLSASQSASILEYLERANLFLVPLDEERQWYRYHHLFADLLRAQLQRSVGAPGVAQLHVRASEWHGQNGSILEAIHHASRASDDERVERFIEQNYRELVSRGEQSWLRFWIGKLSRELVYRRPWLCIYEAYSHSWFGELDEADRLLEEAEKHIRSEISTPDTHPMLGQLAYVKSRVTAMRGDIHRAIELCLAAREYAPVSNLALQLDTRITLGYEYFLDGDYANAGPILNETIQSGIAASAVINTVAASCLMARLYAVQGLLNKSYDTYQMAAQSIPEESGQHLGSRSLVEIGIADVLCEWNDLDAALAHMKQGLALLSWWDKADDWVLAYITLARIHLAQANKSDAVEAVEKALRFIHTRGVFSEARNAVDVAQVRLWLAQGNLQAATRWAASLEQRFGSDDPFRFEHEVTHIAQARVLIAQNNPDEAIGLLSHLEEIARSAGRMGRVIEILLLQALAMREIGDSEHAIPALTKCLTLAESEGYVRVFLDEDQPMKLLLAQWMAHASAGPLRDYAIYLLSQFDTEPQAAQERGAPDGNLVEPLSQRELEVLHIMALGKTNQEIARQLVVARGTVKAHTASIYRKLDVANRTEAVARARQLGILP